MYELVAKTEGNTHAYPDAATLTDTQQELRRELHKTIAKVSDDMGRRQHFNTAIAAIMELLNRLQKAPLDNATDIGLMQEALDAVVLMLAPITPHLSEALWQAMGHQDDVIFAAWPTVDESALVTTEQLIVIQVNGKMRGKINVPVDATAEQVEAIALADENVSKFTDGKTLRKKIYVPGKIFNMVVS